MSIVLPPLCRLLLGRFLDQVAKCRHVRAMPVVDADQMFRQSSDLPERGRGNADRGIADRGIAGDRAYALVDKACPSSLNNPCQSANQ
jgi:hypothetical protein